MPDQYGETIICSHCGAEVPAEWSFCRECGADLALDEPEDLAADLPTGYGEDDEFDYDEFVEREFGEGSWSVRHWAVAAVVVILCLSLLVWQLFG